MDVYHFRASPPFPQKRSDFENFPPSSGDTRYRFRRSFWETLSRYPFLRVFHPNRLPTREPDQSAVQASRSAAVIDQHIRKQIHIILILKKIITIMDNEHQKLPDCLF